MGEIEVSCLRHKELLDDSLVGKLSNFNSKNRQKTGNCATQGVFATFLPRAAASQFKFNYAIYKGTVNHCQRPRSW
jgi:hypothetical protein